MATKVFLFSPGGNLETVIEGVGAANQSSFTVALTIDMSTSLITQDGTTRKILKSEVVQAIRTLEQFIEKDPGSDFG